LIGAPAQERERWRHSIRQHGAIVGVRCDDGGNLPVRADLLFVFLPLLGVNESETLGVHDGRYMIHHSRSETVTAKLTTSVEQGMLIV